MAFRKVREEFGCPIICVGGYKYGVALHSDGVIGAPPQLSVRVQGAEGKGRDPTILCRQGKA